MNQEERLRIQRVAETQIAEFMRGDDTYRVYGPYTNPHNGGRLHCIIVGLKDGKEVDRRTVSYPKLIAEIVTHGTLKSSMTVDHIDRDFTNDNVFNLRVLPQSQHSREDSVWVRAEPLPCTWCGEMVVLTKEQIRPCMQRKAGPFCSRQCRGKYGASVQNGGEIKIRQPIKREYYRLTKKV